MSIVISRTPEYISFEKFLERHQINVTISQIEPLIYSACLDKDYKLKRMVWGVVDYINPTGSGLSPLIALETLRNQLEGKRLYTKLGWFRKQYIDFPNYLYLDSTEESLKRL